MKRVSLALAASVLLALGSGCSQGMVILAALAIGPAPIEAKCSLKGKRVALLITPTMDIQWSHAEHMDRLAVELWRELRDNVPGVEMVPLADIQDLREDRTDFDALTREQVGKKLSSDVVVEVEVSEYTLNKSGADLVLRGNAVLVIRVADVRARGKLLWDGLVDHTYPTGRPEVLGDTDRTSFGRRFLHDLAVHVGRNFYEYSPEDV